MKYFYVNSLYIFEFREYYIIMMSFIIYKYVQFVLLKYNQHKFIEILLCEIVYTSKTIMRVFVVRL